jgi:hypothetical protein
MWTISVYNVCRPYGRTATAYGTAASHRQLVSGEISMTLFTRGLQDDISIKLISKAKGCNT